MRGGWFVGSMKRLRSTRSSIMDSILMGMVLLMALGWMILDAWDQRR
jgi:hypothetical protein